MIYLDHAATTPPLPEVIEAMLPFLRERFGNASSLHAAGRLARAAVERAREEVAAAVGAAPGHVVFTASGSEANNLLLKGVVAAHGRAPCHLVLSAIEHSCLDAAARQLAHDPGGASGGGPGVRCEVTLVAPGPGGVVAAGDVVAALRPATRLVSLMMVNNETGARQPVEEVAAACRARGVFFHTDACQALGRVAVEHLGGIADAVTLCAHKAYGPQGAAALVVRPEVPLRPLVAGGHQEGGRHAGTENVAAIVGFGEAARLAARDHGRRSAEAAACEAMLLAAAASRGVPLVEVLAEGTPRAPGILALRLAGVPREDVVMALDLAGIAVSAGAACQSGAVEPSRVLRAMGAAPAVLRETFRVSAGLATPPGAMELVAEEMERLARPRFGTAFVTG